MIPPLPVEYRGLAADIPDDCLAVPALGYSTPKDFLDALTYAYFWAFPDAAPFDTETSLQNIQAQMIDHATVRPHSYHIFKMKGFKP